MTGILSSKVWHWKIFLTLILIPYRLILAGSGVLLTTTATTPPQFSPHSSQDEVEENIELPQSAEGGM